MEKKIFFRRNQGDGDDKRKLLADPVVNDVAAHGGPPRTNDQRLLIYPAGRVPQRQELAPMASSLATGHRRLVSDGSLPVASTRASPSYRHRPAGNKKRAHTSADWDKYTPAKRHMSLLCG